ncbi:MAG: putative ABC transporter permease subunit, partial [Omnitrophica WOR_2 bacterium]
MSLAITRDSSPRLVYFVWKLLRMRLSIFFNTFRRARLSRKIGTILLGLFILGIFATAFIISWLILSLLNSNQVSQYVQNAQALVESVPVLIIAAAFVGILLTSFGVLLQALYLAGDMDFLLSAPVPIRAVFIAKLLQAIVPNFSLIGLFGLPVLFGLGISRHYNLLYFPLVLVVLAALALAAAGLSSLLVMGIAKIVPARRIAEVLAFFGAIFSMICSQTGQLTNTLNFDRYSPTQISESLNLVSRFNNPWSPLAWAGRALVNIGEGNWLPGLGFLILILGLCSIIFLFSLTTAERLYYSGWASMQMSLRKKKAPRSFRDSGGQKLELSAFSNRLISAPLRGIFVKDWLVTRRDLRNMSQLITPLIFGIIWAFALVRGGGEAPAGRGEAPNWFMVSLQTAMVYANIGISLFVGWSLLSRQAMISFSQEGKNYWIIKSAPISSGKLIVSKFAFAYLPSLVLGWAFLIIISLVQGAHLSVLIFGLPVVALCLAGIAGINLAFGVKGA